MSGMTDSEIAALDAARAAAISYLQELGRSPVAPTVDNATLRKRFAAPLAEAGQPADQVVRDLARDAAGGIMGSAGGRFFGWVIGGCLPAAMGADWLTSAWDQNAALSSCSPAAAIVEEVVGAWLKDLLKLPAPASFALVTGCQMAHVTCLAAARQVVLARIGCDATGDGLARTPQIRVLASENAHGSLVRAVALLGLGRGNLERLPSDALGRMEPEALDRTLATHSGPAILILQAGDIATGAFDRFEHLIPIARRHDLWVHIDGAFGLWASASPRYRHLARGVETADSWATDGHKILNTPFDCGYAFVRDSQAHRAAMSHSASYIAHTADARDQIDWNPDWSRRARGFPTYAALRSLGRAGVADLFERCCARTSEMAAGLERLGGVEVVSRPVINQALVRFIDADPDASPEDHDRRTDEVIGAVNASGEAFFTGADWRGRRVMRISVCNWRTTSRDVARACAAIAKALAASAEQRRVV
jgi:glutamate/tyrosine decarboxylase-like PLP-dependent enzyme